MVCQNKIANKHTKTAFTLDDPLKGLERIVMEFNSPFIIANEANRSMARRVEARWQPPGGSRNILDRQWSLIDLANSWHLQGCTKHAR